MSSAARHVLDEALALPANEREALIDALVESLDPVEFGPGWQEEIRDRLDSLIAGNADLDDAEAHVERLRARFGE